MPLGGGFWKDFNGLGKQNGDKLAPKSHQKSIPTSKGDFFEKCVFPRKTMILKVLRAEAGSKNQSKIDPKMKP